MSYNVPTQNRFAQLDSDAEDEASPKKTAPPQPTSGGTANLTSRGGAQPPSPQQGPPRGNLSSARGGGALRGGGPEYGNGAFRGNRPPRSNFVRPDGEAAEMYNDGRPQPFARRREPFVPGGDYPRGGIRPFRGGARGGRGREFDRQSGTGRGREIKRSGAGGYNWGDMGGEFEGGAAPAPQESGELGSSAEEAGTPTVPEGSPVAGEGETTTPSTDQQQPQSGAPQTPPEVDFAEYQRELRQRRAALLAQQQAAVDEKRVVEDLEKDGFQKYEKEETDEERTARELRLAANRAEDDDDDDDNSHNRRQPANALNLMFQNDFRSRRGGGRFGAMGRGREEGGARGQQQQQQQRRPQQLNIDLRDASAFPSL